MVSWESEMAKVSAHMGLAAPPDYLRLVVPETPPPPPDEDVDDDADEQEGDASRWAMAPPAYAVPPESDVFTRTLAQARGDSPRAKDAGVIRLTVFSNAMATSGGVDMTLAEIAGGMSAGELAGNTSLTELTEKCRRGDPDKSECKKGLPLMMVAGVLRDGKRVSGELQVATSSDLVQIDIDLGELKRTGRDADSVIESFKADPHFAMVFRSPSGACKGLMLVDAFDSHRHAFLSARRYVEETHGVCADNCAKSETQGCFVPHDPELFLNPLVFPLPWTEWKTFTVVREQTGLEPWEVTVERGGQMTPKSLSESFWAHLLAADVPLIFHQGENRFHEYDRVRGIWKPAGRSILGKRLVGLLMNADRSMSGDEPRYPDGLKAPGKLPGLQRLIKNKFQTETLKLLESIVAEVNPFGIGEINGTRHTVAFRDRVVMIDSSQRPAIWWSETHRAGHKLDHGVDVVFSEDAGCPRFTNELLPQLSPDDRRMLELYLGQSLLQRNVTQTFVIVEGPGNDGKSTAANLFARLVGGDNHANLRTKCLDRPFEVGRMAGKTLLVGRDVPGDFLTEDGADMIKALVGGDILQGELKYSNDVLQVHGRFNVLVTTNERQRLRIGGGDIEAWRRRLLFVRLEGARGGASIPDFDELLWREESQGICRLALERAIQLLSTGVSNRWAFGLTPRQVALAEELVAGSDSLRLFVAEAMEKSDRSTVQKATAVEAYEEWCRHSGFEPERRYGLQQRMERWTRELYGVSWSNNRIYGGRALRGLRIKPVES